MNDEEKVTPEKDIAEAVKPETKNLSVSAENEADRKKNRLILTVAIAAVVLAAVIISAIILILSPKNNDDPSSAENTFVTDSLPAESYADDVIASEVSAGGLPVGEDTVRD
ncbi:MAG: hypothetical protein J6X60_12480, partial [Ruminiclostridium sp.]|nr:hypothetical protein [Ruminiclostridium sp.]